nr:hypothetical protein [Tanacetum cinerariifolium]
EEGKNDDDHEDEGDDGEDDEEDEGGDDEQASDKEEFIHPEEGHDEEEDELYRDVIINQERGMESIFETTSQMDIQTPTLVAPFPMSAPTITPSTIATVTTIQQAPTLPTTAPSTLLQDLPNFGSLFGFDNRLKTSEASLSEFMQTNQFAGAVSAIPGIVQRYMDQRMNEAVKMEGNTSIHRSNEQRNLYKALVEAYESDKFILDTYGEIVTLKRRRDDDADNDEEPSAGSDRGSKRHREGKEPESASAPTDTATRS